MPFTILMQQVLARYAAANGGADLTDERPLLTCNGINAGQVRGCVVPSSNPIAL